MTCRAEYGMNTYIKRSKRNCLSVEIFDLEKKKTFAITSKMLSRLTAQFSCACRISSDRREIWHDHINLKSDHISFCVLDHFQDSNKEKKKETVHTLDFTRMKWNIEYEQSFGTFSIKYSLNPVATHTRTHSDGVIFSIWTILSLEMSKQPKTRSWNLRLFP